MIDGMVEHMAWLHNRAGTRLECVEQEIKHESFYNTCYNKAIFKDCWFRNIAFSNCTFLDTMFYSCKFYLCTFSNCRFNGALFSGDMDRCVFNYCDWRKAKVFQHLFHGQSITGTKFDFPIIRIDIAPWTVTVLKDQTMIGCQTRSNSFWLDPCIDEINEMDEQALEWWQANGSIIQAAIRRVS
jgi:uncharacterized protein YjbI with pentapeptide repeats